jgi:hypothetical protein
MKNNINKGAAYKLVLSNLKSCGESKDIFHLIGLIAASESIMSDRLTAFLHGTQHPSYIKKLQENKNGVSFGNLLTFSKEELEKELKPINGIEKIETANLYAEIFAWKEMRNHIIHAVCKSKSKISHKSQQVLFAEAQYACLLAYRLVRLLLKWSSKTKNENKLSKKKSKKN